MRQAERSSAWSTRRTPTLRTRCIARRTDRSPTRSTRCRKGLDDERPSLVPARSDHMTIIPARYRRHALLLTITVLAAAVVVLLLAILRPAAAHVPTPAIDPAVTPTTAQPVPPDTIIAPCGRRVPC